MNSSASGGRYCEMSRAASYKGKRLGLWLVVKAWNVCVTNLKIKIGLPFDFVLLNIAFGYDAFKKVGEIHLQQWRI